MNSVLKMSKTLAEPNVVRVLVIEESEVGEAAALLVVQGGEMMM